jgi:Ni,Fe-hydrogenase maturation factor
MAAKVLLLGYGNIDRQDDGIAWHILQSLAQRFNLTGNDFPNLDLPLEVQFPSPEEITGDRALTFIDLWFVPQISPDLAETISHYDKVCFIDAHTGSVREDVHFEHIDAGYQASPFSHHLTPQTCLELSRVLYGQLPHGFLLSIQGYEFDFSNELSEKTANLAVVAVEKLSTWLHQNT